MTLLCKSCDAIRDTERAFCEGCGEATDSYSWSEPDDGQILRVNGSGSYLGVIRSPVLMGFQREEHTGLIYIQDEAA